MQRYTLKFNFQIKFYFFIENLCFCSLKIAVCVPKITAESKNCRLKITIISKNYDLKIPVRACMCTRVRVYVCACMTEENRTHDHNRHTSGTHDHQKSEEHRQGIKTKFVIVGRSTLQQ